MKQNRFEEALAQIVKDDPRYAPEAYLFVGQALDFTIKKLNKAGREGPERHVSGIELLEGIRQLALQEYGPLALTVLQTWGVSRCEDFGQIVFNLVNKKIWHKTETDSVHDFDGGYDFTVAFRAPFEPEKKCKINHAQ